MFVLLNRVNNINRNGRNRLHPFYMVCISNAGKIVCDHLDPKRFLDLMKYACKGRSEPYADLCRSFNEETNDGRDVSTVSELLTKAIESVVDQKEQSELEDFLNGKDSFTTVSSNGMDDFELVCFLVVRRDARTAAVDGHQEADSQECVLR